MVDIQSAMAKIRQGKKRGKKEEAEITGRRYNVCICNGIWPITHYVARYQLVSRSATSLLAG